MLKFSLTSAYSTIIREIVKIKLKKVLVAHCCFEQNDVRVILIINKNYGCPNHNTNYTSICFDRQHS